ncbi:mechanosensitive ion channel family protein [Paradesertivirga mongoliensis]|uniref:Mechanosensitive ion channel family protein n=1 Tax=Paradesertivirga mongoliensis TaxID=2100740 RepID=A0ABW4ZH71_9SPHI|nr:mechanosensitive ion channel family protein [Pedobacter mongoliensis]
MNWDKFYDKAYDFILLNGPKLISAIIILFIGLWLIRLIKKWLIAGMQKRDLDPSLQPFLQSMIIISLQVMLIIGIMQIAGFTLTIFTTVIGAFGVAAGLALSGTLQNFASGVLILALKPFRVGDNIIAQGQEGTVNSIQIFYTVVTTSDNKTVIIPNSKLSNEIIINTSREGKRRLDIELKLNYKTDFNEVKPIIEEVIKSSKSILKSPESKIGISALEPDGYKITVYIWVNPHGFTDSKLKFQEKLIDDLKVAGVLLPGM